MTIKLDSHKIMREIANVGKKLIAQITGLEKPYKIHTVKTFKDYSLCPKSCILYKLKKNEYDCPDSTYCKEYCDKVKSKGEEIKYVNEKRRFGISNKNVPGRFSHAQMKVAIYLHFHVRKFGIVPHVSVKKSAEYLGMCEKTFVTAIRKLCSENIIDYTQVNSDTYNIFLLDYKNYYKTKAEGGTGHIKMAKEVFDRLLKIDNVNSFRLELRKLLEFDDNNHTEHECKEVAKTYKDIRRFLPGYIKYKSAIKAVIEGTKKTELFDIKEENKTIYFKLKSVYNALKLKERRKDDYRFNVLDEFKSYGINIDLKLASDFVSMSFEYGHQNVLNAIRKAIIEYFLKGIAIKNWGGFVRSLIEKAIWKPAAV